MTESIPSIPEALELPDFVHEAMTTPEAEELGPDQVLLAWELVKLDLALETADQQVLLDAVVATLMDLRQGSSRTRLPRDVRRLHEAEKARHLLGDPDDYRPLVVDGDWLYHQRMLHYEDSLAEVLRLRLGRDEAPWTEEALEEALDDVFDRPAVLEGGVAMELSDEQQEALRTAACAPLAVITGGPGTGKTSIVVSLLRVLVRLGVAPSQIALAAPTGKAAHRLWQSIQSQLASIEDRTAEDAELAELLEEARTLHRLLHYSPHDRTFRHGADNPLVERFVIVDEASMIDLVLMERLASAVRDDAHLVLLGDASQLPSVDSGMVLADLVPAASGESVRLRHSYRQRADDPAGSEILEVADGVRDGEVDAFDAARDAVRVLALEPDASDENRRTLLEFIESWYAERIRGIDRFGQLADRSYRVEDGRFTGEALTEARRLFDHYDRFRILCITRVFATGADAINEVFHARMLRRRNLGGALRGSFVAGEPVLMLKNDYERGLFNGDQGIVLWVEQDEDTRPMAVFPTETGFRAHHLSALRGQLDLAFAMTVHKSQGSEFDDVALVLPEEDLETLLTREILYTGITRARKSVTVLGNPELLKTAIDRPVVRHSGLGEKLS